MPDINTGDTAWMLASAALVLLMTPGLAFFYGGMVRVKSVLNMMMMSFAAISVVSVIWVLYGYSLAFGDSGSPWIGTFTLSSFSESINSVTANGAVYPIPTLVFAAFQLMFAIITPALISGAIADRAKFTSWVVFVALWVSIVYFPVAHWVFDFGGETTDGAGWLAGQGVLDFAGGTAVHINAGAAGLALALVLGKRVGFKKEPMRPHSLPLVLLGAGLLWFGWFGFNAGSALGANGTAALAFMNTQATSWGANGLLYGGGTTLLIKQATGAFAVMIFSFVVTYILGWLIQKTIGFRITRDEEIEGVDISYHAESAYELDSRSGGTFSGTH